MTRLAAESLLCVLTLGFASACAGDDTSEGPVDSSSSGAASASLTGDRNESSAGSSDGAESSTGSGAGSETTGEPTVEPREYYDGEASAALGAATNQARCSTCHSDDGTTANFSGHTFENIAYKDNYKGGGADLLGAINACVTGWMAGPALTETDEAYLGLVEFMQSISDPTETTPNPIMPEVLDDEAAYEAAYAGGDAEAGAAKFTAACTGCHGSALVLGATAAPGLADVQARTIGGIAQQVRTSGPPPSGANDDGDLTPGPMPFFEPSELPTEDLADIIAFIKAPK